MYLAEETWRMVRLIYIRDCQLVRKDIDVNDYPTLHLDIHESNGTAILFYIICSRHDIAEIKC
jgi:hypothetical protein